MKLIPKKTKIISTLGPASEKEETIEELILSGVNVFRFNLKHNEISWHNKRIKRVQKVANKINHNVGVLVDLQGPEIRIYTKNKKTFSVKKDDQIIIGDSFNSEKIQISILNTIVFDSIKKGDVLLIDDGFIEMKVTEKKEKTISAKIIQGGKIKNKKGLNIPGKRINLSSLIDQDIKRLDMIAKSKVDFIALSFVRSKEDIKTLRKEMKKRDIDSLVISKIESEEALENIEEIIDASDGIMIARGDLGVEFHIEQLAFWQKSIVKKCRLKRKPVIIATQMMHSMIKNPRPTRAEAIDVANAVFDKADAVMLSEETAMGKHPVRTVKAMTKILSFNEGKVSFEDLKVKSFNDTELMINAVISLVEKQSMLDIENIIVFSESGYTANVISSFRSKAKIILVSNNKKTTETLSISFGVFPFYAPKSDSENKVFNSLKKEKIIKEGEKVVVIHRKEKENFLGSFSLMKVE